MKKLLLLAIAAVTCQAQADDIFYNGDLDQTGDPRDNGLSSERNGSVTDSQTYDNFTLSTSWGIASLFGNFQDTQSSLCTSIFYDIRQGITEGNGGVDLFSGIVACKGTATGRSLFGVPEIDYVTADINIHLNAGTYFMALSPISTGTGRDFVSTTLGKNAINNVGHPNGQQFINSSYFGLAWNNWQDLLGQGNWDCSYGALVILPEPASVALLGLGLLAVAARRKSRAHR